MLKDPYLPSRGVADARNNSEAVVTCLVVGAEDDRTNGPMVVEKDTYVRVRSLPQEYQAVTHSNHRRKSPWTEWASQSSDKETLFSVMKGMDHQFRL